MANEKQIYNNKNGNLSIEEFLQLIHTNKIDEYIRGFKSTQHKCPPRELIASDQMCFYCVPDFRNCISQVKEFDSYYKIKNKKYRKDDI